MPYQDLRDYLSALEKAGKLKRITKEVDKDWEISAVGRIAFQTIPEAERPALLFENVKNFPIPVTLGVLGGSRAIYALALETTPQGVAEKWRAALTNPIDPVEVPSGVCQENVLDGEAVDLSIIPVPVWTPGEDPGPYLTAPFIFTKDPETGIQNIGTYRCEIKSKNRIAMWSNYFMHGRKHIEMNNQNNQPTPVAIVLGTDPAVGLTSVARFAYGMDELAVAGGLRKEPIKIVKCRTNDLLVPASAEIVLEGEIRPNALEKEGPFGEFTGYMGAIADSFIIDIKCMTYRNNPIYQAFLSQMPPSESSCIRSISWENAIYQHLAKDLHLPIKDVHLLESGGAMAYLAISMKKDREGSVKQAMLGAWAYAPTVGKITVIVDEDIDIRDPFQLNWAMSFRVQPLKDVIIMPDVASVDLDPSQADYEVGQNDPVRRTSSKLGIDATKKHHYPPIALPPKQHLEDVRARWSEYWR